MGPFLMRTDRESAHTSKKVGTQRARFCPPRSTSALIARPWLNARLENGGKLTLLLAPPGSGKSTLLAPWAEHSTHRVAWLLCGQRDRDAAHFFSSLATSVYQTICAGDVVTPESAIDALCDQLSTIQDELAIAIDDLQFLDCAD